MQQNDDWSKGLTIMDQSYMVVDMRRDHLCINEHQGLGSLVHARTVRAAMFRIIGCMYQLHVSGSLVHVPAARFRSIGACKSHMVQDNWCLYEPHGSGSLVHV